MPRGSNMKIKYRTRDLDQIYKDKQPENINRRIKEATEIDEDKPALGQNYCLPCDKYFCEEKALQAHLKQKPHKRRLKALETEPHSQQIADWAAGVGPRKRKREETPTRPDKMEVVPEDPQHSTKRRGTNPPGLEQIETVHEEQSYLARLPSKCPVKIYFKPLNSDPEIDSETICRLDELNRGPPHPSLEIDLVANFKLQCDVGHPPAYLVLAT
ncbi:hypothetical protein ACTXT7_001795 [Hymenolepis weldensis]